MTRQVRRLSDGEFERLLGFRDGLRRFLHWSDEQARSVGLTAAQHQLLLAVRGHRGHRRDPSISDIAEHLMLRHHSAVELIDRAVAAGLLGRVADTEDQRVVRLRLTPLGRRKVEALAAAHLEELSRLRVHFESLWSDLPTPGDDAR